MNKIVMEYLISTVIIFLSIILFSATMYHHGFEDGIAFTKNDIVSGHSPYNEINISLPDVDTIKPSKSYENALNKIRVIKNYFMTKTDYGQIINGSPDVSDKLYFKNDDYQLSIDKEGVFELNNYPIDDVNAIRMFRLIVRNILINQNRYNGDFSFGMGSTDDTYCYALIDWRSETKRMSKDKIKAMHADCVNSMPDLEKRFYLYSAEDDKWMIPKD